jgi:predicted  nucleic acid-binding Zn-ribbon protein
MTEEPPNIVLIKLDEIRREQGTTNAKIGAIAETLIGIKRDIQTLDTRVENVEINISRIHSDIKTLAVAFDEHTRRLDHIEKRLGVGTPAN